MAERYCGQKRMETNRKRTEKIEIVGNLDYVNLACYCNAYANYVETTKQLKDQPYCVERETRTGTIVVRIH